MDTIPHPDIQSLRSQIHTIKVRICDLFEREAQLKNHVLPFLLATYEQTIGVHEYELLQARVRVLELRFRIQRLSNVLLEGKRIQSEHLNAVELQLQEARKQWRHEIDDKARQLEASRSYLRSPRYQCEHDDRLLRHLYRKACLLLHPLLNEDACDHALFWESVEEAYAKKNTKKFLILFSSILSYGELRPPAPLTDNEKLYQERDRLQLLAWKQLQRVRTILRMPPFNLEQELKDQEWIASRRTELQQSTRALSARRKELLRTYRSILAGSNVLLQ